MVVIKLTELQYSDQQLVVDLVNSGGTTCNWDCDVLCVCVWNNVTKRDENLNAVAAGGTTEGVSVFLALTTSSVTTVIVEATINTTIAAVTSTKCRLLS